MAMTVTLGRIVFNPHHKHLIEADVLLADKERDLPYDDARITVILENRNQPISDLQTEAFQKAKDFLLQALSALPS